VLAPAAIILPPGLPPIHHLQVNHFNRKLGRIARGGAMRVLFLTRSSLLLVNLPHIIGNLSQNEVVPSSTTNPPPTE
jgi:hypothetical protein